MKNMFCNENNAQDRNCQVSFAWPFQQLSSISLENLFTSMSQELERRLTSQDYPINPATAAQFSFIELMRLKRKGSFLLCMIAKT